MPRKSKRRSWTSSDVRALKTMARRKTRAASIARTLKRTEGATRQRRSVLDFPSTREPKVGKPDPRTVNSSPALVRGFIVGRMEWSELVEPRHHVRRGAKSAPEDALRKCESIYSREAIAIRPYWHPLGRRLAAPVRGGAAIRPVSGGRLKRSMQHKH